MKICFDHLCYAEMLGVHKKNPPSKPELRRGIFVLIRGDLGFFLLVREVCNTCSNEEIVPAIELLDVGGIDTLTIKVR